LISDQIVKASGLSECDRGICIHYDVAEFQEDLENLQRRLVMIIISDTSPE